VLQITGKMEDWIVDTNIFIHPFNCIIAGPPFSGKTYFLQQLLKFKDILINPTPNRILYCYNTWQVSYDEIKRGNTNIFFNEGLPNFEIINKSYNNLIILDDLMKECLENKSVMNLFTVGTHHQNTSVFFITHNIFSKGKYARDISLNASYMIIFRNPRDKQQIQILARQMYPNDSKFLIESFEDATSKPHGYLLIDLNQNSEMRNRIQSGILPYEKRIFYTPTN
jgi:hypothetical protein